MLEKLNEETRVHVLRVAQITSIFSNDLNMSSDLLYECGLWHDAGKIFILDVISKNTELTSEEKDKIKTHPGLGVEYIEENYNGKYACEE